MNSLTTNFTPAEVTHSTTAQAQGIDNSLPIELESNVRFTAERMEDVRFLLSRPLRINSWYRCEALNTAIGGSKTSQHKLGLAVDFEPIHMSLSDAFDLIAASTISFDQLIIERTKDGADWIHIGFVRTGNPRRDILKAAGNKLGGPMNFERVHKS